MSTLYWITVLSNIHALSFCILLVLILIIIFFSIFGFVSRANADYTDKENIETSNKCFKTVKKLALCSIIPTVALIFIPPTEQLYAIYGVGTVIDYAKGNKEVQKLPDNAVKALNVWLENVNKDKKDSINNN